MSMQECQCSFVEMYLNAISLFYRYYFGIYSFEQIYITTGFVTLVHSYIQVTARLMGCTLFVRALGVSMWKQGWFKYLILPR